MIAGVRYYLTVLSRRQAALAPLLTILVLLGMMYASDAGRPLPAAAVPAIALVPVGAWLMRLVGVSESRTFADITLVALGDVRRRQLCRALAALVVVVILAVVATEWASVTNASAVHPYPAGIVAEIFLMNVTAGIAGIGIGALVSPPLSTTSGAAALYVTFVFVLSLLIPWAPPVGPLMEVFVPHRAPGFVLSAIAMGQAVVVGATCLGASTLLARRRG